MNILRQPNQLGDAIKIAVLNEAIKNSATEVARIVTAEAKERG